MRAFLFRVDRYGWTWLTTSPSPASMQKRLVEEWASGAATEVERDVRGRRAVRV